MKPALILAAMLATAVGAFLYERVALGRGIIAKINSRTLHERTVPRGGGITFGVALALAMLVAWWRGTLPTTLLLAVGLGGAAATAVGFFDDVYGIRALPKLGLQACLAGWLVAVIYGPYLERTAQGLGAVWRVASLLALWFVPVWLINLYNFIDGVDGMAILGSVFISSAAIIVLVVTNGDPELIFAFALLGAASAGFLFVNLPPARMFMGDAGSIVLGYCYAALLLITTATGAIALWTWMIMLSYFIADTTTTFICRLFVVREWWRGHRSHAYQNVARITKSHAKVTYGVAVYHVIWGLPLAVWSAVQPEWAPLAAALAFGPPVVWTLRFGPLLSSA